MRSCLSKLGALPILMLSFSAGAYNQEQYIGLNLMGQGGAGLADVSDGGSVFLNPAGLTRNTTKQVEIQGIFGGTMPVLTDFREIGELYNSNDALADGVMKFGNRPLGMNAQIIPTFLYKNFALGYYNILDANAYYNNAGDPSVRFNMINDSGVFAGFGLNYHGFRWGVSGRSVSRAAIIETFTDAELANFNRFNVKNRQRKGTAFGLNMGFQYDILFNESNTVALGMNIEDFTGLSFSQSDPNLRAPENEQAKLHVGTTWSHRNKLGDWKFLADLRDIGENEYSNNLALGVQYKVVKSLDLKLGMFNYLPTAGISYQPWKYAGFHYFTFGEKSLAELKSYRHHVVGLKVSLPLEVK